MASEIEPGFLKYVVSLWVIYYFLARRCILFPHRARKVWAVLIILYSIWSLCNINMGLTSESIKYDKYANKMFLIRKGANIFLYNCILGTY